MIPGSGALRWVREQRPGGPYTIVLLLLCLGMLVYALVSGNPLGIVIAVALAILLVPLVIVAVLHRRAPAEQPEELRQLWLEVLNDTGARPEDETEEGWLPRARRFAPLPPDGWSSENEIRDGDVPHPERADHNQNA